MMRDMGERALGARSSGRADRLRPGLRRLEGAAVGRVCAAREREIVWQAEVELIRGRLGGGGRGRVGAGVGGGVAIIGR